MRRGRFDTPPSSPPPSPPSLVVHIHLHTFIYTTFICTRTCTRTQSHIHVHMHVCKCTRSSTRPPANTRARLGLAREPRAWLALRVLTLRHRPLHHPSRCPPPLLPFRAPTHSPHHFAREFMAVLLVYECLWPCCRVRVYVSTVWAAWSRKKVRTLYAAGADRVWCVLCTSIARGHVCFSRLLLSSAKGHAWRNVEISLKDTLHNPQSQKRPAERPESAN